MLNLVQDMTAGENTVTESLQLSSTKCTLIFKGRRVILQALSYCTLMGKTRCSHISDHTSFFFSFFSFYF